jgi:AraC-like DNA-binding protein
MNTAVPAGGGAASLARAVPTATVATSPAPGTLFTTAGLPARQQFDAWRHQAVPYLDIAAPAAGTEAGFAASAAALRFGPFLLYAASLPAYDHARSAARIRRDSLDHWMVAICRRGTHRQRSGDASLVFRPGTPYVLSMARAFEAQRAGARIDWLTLHVARDAVPELEAPLTAAIYAPLDGVAGLLLADFLGGLRDRLEGLQAPDLTHLATATQALLTAAILPAGGAGPPQIEQIQLARLRRIIRENLGAATLRPGRLAALAGMSRSQLYRLFEPQGGVAHAIQRERLRRARRLLSDPADRRDIAALAEASGFFDPSSFSRAFRREFGCTPREARLAALVGTAVMPAATPCDSLADLLRDL